MDRLTTFVDGQIPLTQAIAACLKTAVQEILGALMFNRIDPASFLPPSKPKPKSRGWGKGTVDYSKWDALADEEEEEERIVEMLESEQRERTPEEQMAALQRQERQRSELR